MNFKEFLSEQKEDNKELVDGVMIKLSKENKQFDYSTDHYGSTDAWTFGFDDLRLVFELVKGKKELYWDLNDDGVHDVTDSDTFKIESSSKLFKLVSKLAASKLW